MLFYKLSLEHITLEQISEQFIHINFAEDAI